jgi:hypothetical protein
MSGNVLDFKPRPAKLPRIRVKTFGDFGCVMFPYKFTYFMRGREWASVIWATSREDAEARLAAMHENVCLCGRLDALK